VEEDDDDSDDEDDGPKEVSKKKRVRNKKKKVNDCIAVSLLLYIKLTNHMLTIPTRMSKPLLLAPLS
jgi:hypothetical protein